MQLEQLIELHNRYADQGFAIFALAVDPFETPEAAKDIESLILTMKLPFPVGAATRELANDYHYKGVPATIVLDGEGKIARIFYGFHEMEKIEPIIKTLLANQEVKEVIHKVAERFIKWIIRKKIKVDRVASPFKVSTTTMNQAMLRDSFMSIMRFIDG